MNLGDSQRRAKLNDRGETDIASISPRSDPSILPSHDAGKNAKFHPDRSITPTHDERNLPHRRADSADSQRTPPLQDPLREELTPPLEETNFSRRRRGSADSQWNEDEKGFTLQGPHGEIFSPLHDAPLSLHREFSQDSQRADEEEQQIQRVYRTMRRVPSEVSIPGGAYTDSLRIDDVSLKMIERSEECIQESERYFKLGLHMFALSKAKQAYFFAQAALDEIGQYEEEDDEQVATILKSAQTSLDTAKEALNKFRGIVYPLQPDALPTRVENPLAHISAQASLTQYAASDARNLLLIAEAKKSANLAKRPHFKH